MPAAIARSAMPIRLTERTGGFLMIELFQFPPAFGVPSASPFCVKLELLLKMANIPYKNRYDADVRKAPKAKLPYVVIDEKEIVSDSELILRRLKQSGQFTLDDGLSDVQKAQSTAITRLVEDHLYWLMIRERWLNDDVWPVLRGVFFAKLPPVVRSIVPGIVRKQVRKRIHGQGLGRHSEEEVGYFAEQDFTALDVLLSDKPYMLCERICSVDAAVYGLLCSVYYPDFDTPLKAIALGHPNLAAYCDRISKLFFPDYSREKANKAGDIGAPLFDQRSAA
jgi:glutathione S-transferase